MLLPWQSCACSRASDCSPVGNGGVSVDEESEEEEEEEEEEEDENDKEEEEEEDESEKEEEMKLKKMEEQKTQSNKVWCLAAGWDPQEEATLVTSVPAGALLTMGYPGRVPVLGLLWLCCSCGSRHTSGSWTHVHELQLPFMLRTCCLVWRVLRLFCGPW